MFCKEVAENEHLSIGMIHLILCYHTGKKWCAVAFASQYFGNLLKME